MSVEEKQNEMDKALFSSLIMMLSSSAMQQLGKIINPMTNKTEINLEMAQMTIDMLSMLKTKTEGNLDKDEAKMMADILASLQMNFVETSANAKGSPAEAAPEQKPDEQPEQKIETKGKNGHAEPKFHKSYGK